MPATFVDEVVIQAKAGDGGNGAVAWRREKYVPLGGPAGGDGGNGGDIVFVADLSIRSLLDLKYRPHTNAKSGENGRNKNQFGKGGDDLIVRLPIGTQVVDENTGEVLCDLADDGERIVVCYGGSGGHGNARFATASNHAPDYAKPGLAGDERRLRLSLKLMADVGLLGFPNAGKSTFLSVVTAAKPKIANYPFTTLIPKLGVVGLNEGESFVLADIPGLVEGAASGAGLGHRFLKHLERVRVLLHLVEAPSELYGDAPTVDESRVLHRYLALRDELRKFDEDLANTPEIVCISKCDLINGDPLEDPEVARLKRVLDESGTPLLFMSAATNDGVDGVKRACWNEIKLERHERGVDVKQPYDPLKA